MNVPSDKPSDNPSHAPKFAKLPVSVAAGGLGIIASAFVPLLPDGQSFAQAIAYVLGRDLRIGLLLLFAFGSPFAFGGFTAAMSLVGWRNRGAERLFSQAMLLTLLGMQVQIVHSAFLLAKSGSGVAPIALLGFGVVSGVYFAYRHANAHASDRELSPRALVAWGALLIVAVMAWLRLQVLGGVRMGPAVETMWISGLSLIYFTRRRAPQAPRPVSDDEAEQAEPSA